ncbi:MAG: hypothetical protein RL215_2558 [Planctomycetota bacterium]
MRLRGSGKALDGLFAEEDDGLSIFPRGGPVGGLLYAFDELCVGAAVNECEVDPVFVEESVPVCGSVGEADVVIPGFFRDEVSVDVDEWPNLLWSAVHHIAGPFGGYEGDARGVVGLGVEPLDGSDWGLRGDEFRFGRFSTSE